MEKNQRKKAKNTEKQKATIQIKIQKIFQNAITKKKEKETKNN